jgi:hypothetical protein
VNLSGHSPYLGPSIQYVPQKGNAFTRILLRVVPQEGHQNTLQITQYASRLLIQYFIYFQGGILKF